MLSLAPPMAILTMVLSAVLFVATVMLFRKPVGPLATAKTRFSFGVIRVAAIYLSVITLQYWSGSLNYVADGTAKIGFPVTVVQSSPWMESAAVDLSAIWLTLATLVVASMVYAAVLVRRGSSHEKRSPHEPSSP